MNKLTKRIKKNRKNRTIKRGGNSDQNFKQPEFIQSEKSEKEEREEKERKGVIDIIVDKAEDIGSSLATTVADTGLRIVGLERIDKDKEEETVKKVDENIAKIGDTASGIVSDVRNFIDKTGAVVIDNLNDVLGSDAVKETTKQAAENTAEIIEEQAEIITDTLNRPEVKEKFGKAINIIGQYASIGADALKEPLEKVTNIASDSFKKAEVAAAEGGVKTIAAVIAAAPGIGAIIDLGMAANSASKAARSVIDAGSETIEALSDAVIDTKKNFEEGVKKLKEKQDLANQISNRTTKSMENFMKPLNIKNNTIQVAGKTRRRLSKRKGKSKRVRFAF